MNQSSSKPSLPILNWLDGPIKQSFNNVFKGLNTSTESLDLFNKFRKAHFKKLHEEISNIKVLGMSEPTPLLQIYSPLYLSTTIHRRLYEQEIYTSDLSTITKRRSGEKVCAETFIEKHNRVALLGSAGSGKTTLLRYLALAYSDKNIFKKSKLKTQKVPFYISLLEYSKQRKVDSIFNFITHELSRNTNEYAVDYLKRIFEKGLAVILLDSMDEISSNLRKEIYLQIKQFCTSFPDCKIIIT